MRFTVSIALACALIMVIVAGPGTAAPPTPVSAAAAATVRFLFDLGDGTYHWTSETIPDPSAGNATWDAVQDAAARLGLHVSWSWFSCCGVFIQDIGDRSPPSGSVGLFLWNATARAWDSALVGVSSLVLQPGDAVALSNNAFDPVSFATLSPIPTPEHPTPAIEFRGDYANTGVSSSSAPNGVDIRWDRDLGIQEIPSSPAVAYGRVYVLTLDGLFALDESSGAVLWTNPRIRGLSTPAVFNGTLILGGSDGKVHAIDAGTGQEIWNTTLVTNPFFSGITSSPKILFSTAYVGTFNESGGPGEVVALWATNGTIVWRQSAPGSVSFSSPAVVEGRLVVGIIGRYNTTSQITYDPPYGVLALDAHAGAPLWFHPTNDSVAASPAVAGDSVYVPSKDGHVYALDLVDGSLRWARDVPTGVSSPAVWNGTLYVAGGSFGGPGRVTAMDALTGDVRWTFAPNGPVQSSVSYADGTLFFSTNAANGTIYALDATAGRLVWSYTPAPAQYILGSPVVADGMVFAPSDNGHVYAFQNPRTIAAAAFPWEVPALSLVVVSIALAAAVWVRRRRRSERGP